MDAGVPMCYPPPDVVKDTVMFATIASDGETTKRDLSPDDIRAVCAIYPASGDPHIARWTCPRTAAAAARAGPLRAWSWRCCRARARARPAASPRVVFDARPRPARDYDPSSSTRRSRTDASPRLELARHLQLLLGVAVTGRDDGQPPVAGDEAQQTKRAVALHVGARLRAARADRLQTAARDRGAGVFAFTSPAMPPGNGTVRFAYLPVVAAWTLVG